MSGCSFIWIRGKRRKERKNKHETNQLPRKLAGTWNNKKGKETTYGPGKRLENTCVPGEIGNNKTDRQGMDQVNGSKNTCVPGQFGNNKNNKETGYGPGKRFEKYLCTWSIRE